MDHEKLTHDRQRTLVTSRLLLRPWQESDVPDLYEYARDSQVSDPAGWQAHTDPENSAQILEKVLCVPETYAICRKEDGKAIGSISLKMGEGTDMTDRSDECELGYWLGRPHWGQGIVPEAAEALLRHAFEDLGMRAVWCGYYEGNEKSHRVQEKLGFSYHHTTEKIELPLLGEYRTGHCSLLTRKTWEQRRDKKMTDYFKSVLEQDPDPVVLCDLSHKILYMNPAAIRRYARFGGETLVGKSLLDCHDPNSNALIGKVLDWFRADTSHNRVHTVYKEQENKDVYMVALRREDGQLIGYYEKHECRDRDQSPFYFA